MRRSSLSALLLWSATAWAGPKPTIPMEQARATALARVAGVIKSAELEKERGVLLYSFDIRTADKKIIEVQVDANTGAVISVEREKD